MNDKGKTTWKTIKEVSVVTGLSEMWVRNLIKQGKVRATKGTVPGTDIPRWKVVLEDVVKTQTGVKSRREDGRAKWSIYLTADEEKKLREILKTAGFEVPIKRANKVKGS